MRKGRSRKRYMKGREAELSEDRSRQGKPGGLTHKWEKNKMTYSAHGIFQ